MTPAVDEKNLSDIIREEAAASGPLDFARFMETALYHPRLGYYSQNERTDDYYTSVDVHPIFAILWARYFFKEWEKKFSGQNIRLIELGAGAGLLADKILNECKKFPEFYEKISYVAVETSELRRQAAEKNLSQHARFKTASAFDFPENSIQGFIFSNEFFDALPVRRAVKKNGRLSEIFVDGSLKETVREASPELRRYFEWLKIEPAEDCKAEAHLQAREWMAKIARSLQKGLVASIDYGMSARELYSEERTEGTLLGHYRHQTNRDFFERIGEQDLTAHVNFTALIQEGEERGLGTRSFQTQSQFFLENGMEDLMEAVNRETDPRAKLKASAAVKSLIHPEGMGGTFKVLLQEK